MNIIKYKYYITYSYISTNATIEVFPLGVDKLKINYKGDSGRIFKRRELDGKLIFRDQPLIPSTDYTLFKNIDESIYDKCSEIKFEIQRSCDNGTTYQSFWDGYFSVTDGEFNLDKCIFSVGCQPDDEYRCFIEGSESEKIPNVTYKGDILATIVTQYEFFTCRNNLTACNALRPGPNPTTTWLIFHQETCEGLTNYVYYREVTVVACQNGIAISPGSGWVQDLSYGDCTNGLSKWVRTPQIVVTNNPNPDVTSGNCVGDTDTAPPKEIFLGVVKQSTAQTPVIVGKNIIQYLAPAAATPEYYYVKFPKANATYSWSITGAGNSIVGSTTNNSVIINVVLAGSINVIETTTCGASSMITQSWTICGGSGCSTYNSEVEIIGNEELCTGETAQYCLNGETGRTPVILGGSSTDSVLNVITSGQGTHGCFEIVAGIAGTIQVGWSGGAARDSLTTPGIIITVKVKKVIQPIYGDGTVCNNSHAYYSIPDTDLGGFAWRVDNGTILSGQGTNEVLVEWDGINGVGFVYVSQDFNCGCAWIQIAPCGGSNECSWWWCPSDNEYEFINTTTLEDTVNFFIEELCEGGDVVSDFFEWNPPGDTSGYVAGINYVTGLANQLTYITLQPMRSVLYGLVTSGQDNYLQPSLDEVLTWKNLEEIFREVFNAYWFIENGVVRIEHISWFNRVVAYDLTDSFYHKYSVGKNIYSYDKIKAPKFERFKWQQALYLDFVGSEISYSGTCTTTEESQMVSNRGVGFIITDLQQIVLNPNNFSRDGFALLCNNSSYILQHEEGQISGISQPNGHLSWANLHYNYHRYDRVLLNGMMNLQQTIFLSARRFKKQNDVTFPFCCTDELNTLEDLITTLVGNGVIDSAEHDLKSDTLKVTLLHDF